MTDFQDKIALLIPAYLRGDLSDAETQQVEAAAAADPAIAADIAFQRNISASLKADDSAPSAPSWDSFQSRLQAETSSVIPANDSASPARNPWRYAAAALAVIGVGQAGAIGFIASQGDAPVAQYATVSTSVADSVLKIGFADNATETAIREELLNLEARIVDGPTALGLYTLRFETAEICSAAQAQLSALPLADTVSACG